MDVVSEIVSHQPGLRTVILNTSVLSYPSEYLEPWFYKLNIINLKFLLADDVKNIDDAFRNLDANADGKISVRELAKLCGSNIAQYWAYKYGPAYEVSWQTKIKEVRNDKYFIVSSIDDKAYHSVENKTQNGKVTKIFPKSAFLSMVMAVETETNDFKNDFFSKNQSYTYSTPLSVLPWCFFFQI